MNESNTKLIEFLERLRDKQDITIYFRGVDISTLPRKALEGALFKLMEDHVAEMKTIYERRYY